MLLRTSSVLAAVCCTLRAISAVALPCSSMAAAIVAAIGAHLPDGPRDVADCRHGFLRRGLDLIDLRADILGRIGGLLRQALHLGGDDGEPLAGIAGARRLDGRIQRQQVGLATWFYGLWSSHPHLFDSVSKRLI